MLINTPFIDFLFSFSHFHVPLKVFLGSTLKTFSQSPTETWSQEHVPPGAHDSLLRSLSRCQGIQYSLFRWPGDAPRICSGHPLHWGLTSGKHTILLCTPLSLKFGMNLDMKTNCLYTCTHSLLKKESEREEKRGRLWAWASICTLVLESSNVRNGSDVTCILTKIASGEMTAR